MSSNSLSHISDAQLHEYLQICCLERGLPISGTTEELRARLRYRAIQLSQQENASISSTSSEDTRNAAGNIDGSRRPSNLTNVPSASSAPADVPDVRIAIVQIVHSCD